MISEHKFAFSCLFSDANDARNVEFDANDTMALTPPVTVLRWCSAVNCYIQSSCHVGHTTAPSICLSWNQWWNVNEYIVKHFFEENLLRELRKEARKARDLLIKLFLKQRCNIVTSDYLNAKTKHVIAGLLTQ